MTDPMDIARRALAAQLAVNELTKPKARMTIPDLIAAGQAFRGESDQYAELITELADALASTIATMHERELHHFEVEQDNANLREVPQKVYNALHTETRERALEILHRALHL